MKRKWKVRIEERDGVLTLAHVSRNGRPTIEYLELRFPEIKRIQELIRDANRGAAAKPKIIVRRVKERLPKYNMYRCPACKKIIERCYCKPTLRSMCDATGKTVTLRKVKGRAGR